VAGTDIPTTNNPPSGIILAAELLAVDVELELLVAPVFVPVAVAVLEKEWDVVELSDLREKVSIIGG
jgi:hypothetical protein